MEPPRRALETLCIIVLVACACWNIWAFGRNSDRLGPRQAEDSTVWESECEPVRNRLIERNYGKGPVGLINNRTLAGLPSTVGDSGRWAHAQYAMVPWILVLNGNSVGAPVADTALPFVVGDFWDGPPSKVPPDLVEIYRGPNLFLYERRTP